MKILLFSLAALIVYGFAQETGTLPASIDTFGWRFTLAVIVLCRGAWLVESAYHQLQDAHQDALLAWTIVVFLGAAAIAWAIFSSARFRLILGSSVGIVGVTVALLFSIAFAIGIAVSIAWGAPVARRKGRRAYVWFERYFLT